MYGIAMKLLWNCYEIDNCYDFKTRKFNSTRTIDISKEPTLKTIYEKSTQDLKNYEDISIIYHLAAINGTELFYKIPYEVARTNMLVTINLLDWLEKIIAL